MPWQSGFVGFTGPIHRIGIACESVDGGVRQEVLRFTKANQLIGQLSIINRRLKGIVGGGLYRQALPASSFLFYFMPDPAAHRLTACLDLSARVGGLYVQENAFAGSFPIQGHPFYFRYCLNSFPFSRLLAPTAHNTGSTQKTFVSYHSPSIFSFFFPLLCPSLSVSLAS